MKPSNPSTSEDRSLTDDFVEAGMSEPAARIMVVALELFAEKGYAATTVREIVNNADVTNPMLYYYFESKKGVFVALLDVLFESMAETVKEVLDQETGFYEQLRGVGLAHFTACRNAPQILRFIYSVTFGPVRSRPEFDVTTYFTELHELVETTIARAIESDQFQPRGDAGPGVLTERFMGLISNHLMGVLSVYDGADHVPEGRESVDDFLGEEALDEMLDFYFHGAGTLATENS